MKKSIDIIRILLVLTVLSPPLTAQKTIRAVEWWTDGNAQMRTYQPATPGAAYNWEELVPFSTLSDGVHTFNARFCDNEGVWTTVQSHFFLKQTTAAGTGMVKKITSLEYWINGNSTERTHCSLTAQSTYNWEELLDYTAIPDGVNSFSARFRDEFGAWSTVQSHFFLKQTTAAGTGTMKKITALEFWINGNSDTRSKRTLTAQNPYNWEELLDYAAIPDGINTFNARFMDEFGAWTNVQSHFFLKQTASIGTGLVKKITALEYWINGNSDARTKRTLTAQNPYNWEELLDYSAIPDGVNSFNARFRDEFGAWSTVQSHFFLKQTTAAGTGTVKKITALEYWINGNSTERTHRALTAQNTYNWEELLDYSAIPDGVNSFNARFRDEFGAWSTVQSHFFLKQTIATGENKIVSYRLWYAAEPEYIHDVAVASPTSTVDINDSVSVTYLPKGSHQISYQVKDVRGVWSPAVTDTISKTDNAFFSFTADKREISQNESVTFTPSIRHFIDSIVWNFGDGMTEVNFEPVHTYDSIGHFDVTATVWHKGTLEGVSYVEIKYISVTPTGITTPEVSTIRMYPVPVSDMLTVESPDTPLRALRVVALNGTIVRQVTCRGENTSDISLGGLSPGTYIILTTTDKGVFSGKVVKK